MLTHRRSESLDKTDRGWLRAKHHFQISAAGNPAHGPLGSLIVWNDDEIAAGAGFPLHSHSDLEIVTYVRQGQLAHRDTLGSEGRINAGEVQVMSAGKGIRHAEFNVGEVPLQLYQIWFLPRDRGLEPRWETRAFARREQVNRFAVLASGIAEDAEGLPIRTNARVLGANLKSGARLHHRIGDSLSAYLVVASGRIAIDGQPMSADDGAAISHEPAIEIAALEDSELVMVEAGKESVPFHHNNLY